MTSFLKRAALVVLAFAFLAGCAATGDDIKVHRSPKELYDRAVNLFFVGRYDEAEASFKKIMEDFPLSPHSVEAELMLGDLSYKREMYEDAASYYTNFAALHPSHPRAPYALFQKGMSHFKDILSIDRDQTATRKALFAFEDLVRSYPESPYREKAEGLMVFLRERLAARELYVAKFYYKNKNYTGALERFRNLLKDYPESSQTEESLFYMGESYLKIGEEDLAREAFSTLIDSFPDGPFSDDARKALNRLG